jgi:deoxycytidine triphosphate deaminase
MYLVDRQLKDLLPEMAVQPSTEAPPFSVDDQIQPCSIDLRLDRTFWRGRFPFLRSILRPWSRPIIDLRRAKLLEMSPRREWRRYDLHPSETILIRPGELLLGRTCEEFTIPKEVAGKLEGRSSFARMGLSIHCSADFINPGYRGRMTLQLVNHSRTTIRLVPYLPICQLMLIALIGQPERTYGDREIFSKYMNDDGGPSYWWRDKRIRELHKRLGERDVHASVQAEVLKRIGSSEPEVIERLEDYVNKQRVVELTNASDLLEGFSRSGDRTRLWRKFLKATVLALTSLLVAAGVGIVFERPYWWMHYIVWGAALISVPIGLVAFRYDLGQFFGKSEAARSSNVEINA